MFVALSFIRGHSRMHTGSKRTGAIVVASLVVLSIVGLPAAGGATTGTHAQQGTDGAANDGFENATQVGTDSAINGEIGEDGAADVYSFELNEGSQVEIAQGIGGGAYPVTLFDEDGEVLDRIPDQDVYTAREATLRANASYSGTYYLRVDGDPGEEYSIGISVTEPDANEPNDGRDEATETEIGERNRGTIVRGDLDVYSVRLEDGQEIGIAANATGPTAVTVYGPDGEEIGSADAFYPGGYEEGELGRRSVLNVTAESTGTYYLEVSIPPNNSGNVNGEYNLTVVERASVDSVEGSSNDGSDSTETTTETTRKTAADDGDGRATASAMPTSGDTANGGATTTSSDDDSTATTTGTTTAADTADTTARTDGSTGTDVSPGGNDAEADGSLEETAVNGPGFGIVGALIALVVVGLATRRN